MPGFIYDSRFAHPFTESNDGGQGGGSNGNQGGKDGGAGEKPGGANEQKPPWEEEFGSSFDPERAWKALEASRREARTHRSAADRAATALKEKEDAEKTELEKATARVKELEGKVTDYEQREKRTLVRGQITEAAKRANAILPEDLYRYVEESDLEVGEDGRVKNLDAVIADIKKSRPVLFGARGSADGGAGRQNGGASPNGKTNMNQLLADALNR